MFSVNKCICVYILAASFLHKIKKNPHKNHSQISKKDKSKKINYQLNNSNFSYVTIHVKFNKKNRQMFASMFFDNVLRKKKIDELQFKFHFVRFVIQNDFSPVIEHKEFEKKTTEKITV